MRSVRGRPTRLTPPSALDQQVRRQLIVGQERERSRWRDERRDELAANEHGAVRT
jgi:hypothetical protein